VIYQQPALLPDLSVAENVALGDEPAGLFRRVDWAARRRRAAELLARLGLALDPDRPARTLSMPEKQLCEIARALGASARVLVLDEPTASLSVTEVQTLLALLRDLRAQGLAIVYVSHRLEEVFAIADRVTVLRDGAVVETRAARELDRASLIRLMVGRELLAEAPRAAGSPAARPSRPTAWAAAPPACTTCPSPCARARSSGCSVSSTAGGRSSRGCSPASPPRTRARSAWRVLR
jgi:rhamnose transport system ATP-binding protein